MPFLRNVTRGRDVPESRLAEVAEQYEIFGGKSPINEQNRRLREAIERELERRGRPLPVYWGNRNWSPYVDDVVSMMAADDRRHAVAITTSAYSSYSSCRQYVEDLAGSLEKIQSTTLTMTKLGPYHDAEGFVQPLAERLASALADCTNADVHVLFTAHSIPDSMASVCAYETQLRSTSAAVVDSAQCRFDWDLVFQSRSGRPGTPWLEPDVSDALERLAAQGVAEVVVVPVGFVSDHMEVLYDLDHKAAATARECGIRMHRVKTVGDDPRFVAMLVDRVLRFVDGDVQSVPSADDRPQGAGAPYIRVESGMGCNGKECCLPGH